MNWTVWDRATSFPARLDIKFSLRKSKPEKVQGRVDWVEHMGSIWEPCDNESTIPRYSCIWAHGLSLARREALCVATMLLCFKRHSLNTTHQTEKRLHHWVIKFSGTVFETYKVLVRTLMKPPISLNNFCHITGVRSDCACRSCLLLYAAVTRKEVHALLR